MNSWHKLDISDVSLEFGTDVSKGRTNIKQERRHRGNNNIFLLPTVNSKAALKKLTSDASLALLALVYVLTAFMGHYTESVVGLCLLFVAFFISFLLYNASSCRVVNSYKLLLPSANIIENGNKKRLSILDVDIGDLVEFSQGDIIPADARIVFSTNLTVAERCFDPITGKPSYRKEKKNAEIIIDDSSADASFTNMVYASSVVVSGSGRAIVTETGSNTKLSQECNKIRIASDTDLPSYCLDFFKAAKRISLIAFLAVIPITFISLIFHGATADDSEAYNLIYELLLLLSLAVTCMSELIISPAESLVTKELLVSSRKGKVRSNTDSRITKLSSAESIADTDTVLFLLPEAFIDKRKSVCRIVFSDKRYRFDALRSDDLTSFFEQVFPIFKYSRINNLSEEMQVINNFLEKLNIPDCNKEYNNRPKFLKNFPTTGSRACVLSTDANGEPDSFIFYSDNINQLYECAKFRTEGGGLWSLDSQVAEDILSEYEVAINSGLSIISFFSYDKVFADKLIFEGFIAVGNECPFSDGALSEEYHLSGINTIMFLDKETSQNISFVKDSGFVSKDDEIALASVYAENGLDVIDAPINTKAYVGFDRNEIKRLTERLIRNGRKVLPIIKDSTDRKGIAPLSVYAAHIEESYDSIRIQSSVSIQPVDTTTGKGGAFDILNIIRGSSMARLKLGIYKNYLAFSMFLRIAAIGLSIMLGRAGNSLTSIMILCMGFVCDAAALSSFMMSKGIPVKPQDATTEAKTLFSPYLFLVFSVAGLISGAVQFALTELLIRAGSLSLPSAATYLTYAVMISQIISLGGFLLILNKRSRRRAMNWLYIAYSVALFGILFIQSYFSESLYNTISSLNYHRIDLRLMPFLIFGSFISFIAVLLISRLITLISDAKHK